MLNDFVCEAINFTAISQSAAATRADIEGVHVLDETVHDCSYGSDCDTPPAVRILPMNSDVELPGHSIEDVQKQFFLKELLARRPPGKYQFRESGLDAPPGTIVLFQYQGKLIASATLIEIEGFASREKGIYRGALHFDPKSIRVFDPVGADVLRAIWPEFKRFGQAKQKLDPRGYTAFAQKLTGVKSPK